MASKLKKPISFETTFGTYVVDEILGEGGAGRVYGGVGIDDTAIALKVLAEERATKDKRGRFKNEIAFLTRNKHQNIVAVLDHGIVRGGEIVGPFYVMRRYRCNLRNLIQESIKPERVLPLFSQILDGVEAAHLQGVVHRDLKPENILCDRDSDNLAIADFGIARFTEDLVATAVETGPAQRLANFQYAAPEQRTPGNEIRATVDIYSLGLMLNELFTGIVPHGTEFKRIGQVAPNLGFLDEIVERMLRQAPDSRPTSISDLKGIIQLHQSEAVSLQRLSVIADTVVKANEIDEPLALTPPTLIGADWDRGQLVLTLDRPVTRAWIGALQQMSGGYRSLMGRGPNTFSFRGNQAYVAAQENEVQLVINYFKSWLPIASQTLRNLCAGS